MQAPDLTTRVRLLPLLLCCLSAHTAAGDLAPLRVSPALLGPSLAQAGTAGMPDRGTQAAGQPETQVPAPVEERTPGSTDVTAQRIFGTRMQEMVADGDVELTRDGVVVTADRLTFRELADEIQADGNVRIVRDADVISGPRARIVLHEWTGEFETPTYSLSRPVAGAPADAPREAVGGGAAEVLYFEGENQFRLRQATWSTCPAPDPDWYLKSDDLALDYDREVGVSKGSSLVFQDLPILWWPYVEFPLVEQRQSGLLAPTIGLSNKTGFDMSMPYYFNIAPNYDATLAPRIMSRRGLQLAGEFRYLTPNYSGDMYAEVMARDRMTGESRSLGSLRHQQKLAPNLVGSLNLNSVSDDTYFEDLSSRVENSSRTNLLREARLNYTGGWWTASGLVQSYQTLSGEEPYRRVPQILVDGRRADLPAAGVFAIHGEYVEFDHANSNFTTGSRFVAYPQLSLPYEQAGYFITPKVGAHYTRYALDNPQPGGRDDITRSIPVFTVDSGMFYDRDTALFGNAYRQTLEPRLMYVNVPYRRQDDIPVFDTANYDFGFAQIFSENRYSGVDRIADANQVTAAVTTRYIEPDSGIERFRATVGQRYYFEDRRVRLPDEPESASNTTDILAAANGRVTATTSIDTAFQYNPNDDHTQRFNFGVRYQPEYAKALNLTYRYSRDVLRDIDVSGQWPLGGGWYGVARVSRSIEESRITEAIGGIEYDGGCWAFRTAIHRFAINPDDTNNAVFFQLELSGLGSLGPSPVSLLRRSVPGYGKINESPSSRVFGGN